MGSISGVWYFLSVWTPKKTENRRLGSLPRRFGCAVSKIASPVSQALAGEGKLRGLRKQCTLLFSRVVGAKPSVVSV